MKFRRASARRCSFLAVAAVVTLAGCDGDVTTGPDPLECSLPPNDLVNGGDPQFTTVPRDSLFALTNPDLARFGDPGLFFLSSSSRVIGIIVNGLPVAIPHNILWWHEIINLNVPGRRLTVTYSPLTGSSLVFDRGAAGVDSFFVSDFVVNNNLVMQDESGSLWPQMSLGARCGVRDGIPLAIVPHVDLRWSTWFNMHLDTWVVSNRTGFERLYTLYPYGDHEELNSATFPFPVSSVDGRRPPKERVLGIPSASGGVAFPFGLMADRAEDGIGLGNATVDGRRVVVFWNSAAQGAIPYAPEANGLELDFLLVEGQRRDVETGSVWNFNGQAVSGPMDGAELEPFADAYVSFWFAWALFQPETEIWAGG